MAIVHSQCDCRVVAEAEQAEAEQGSCGEELINIVQLFSQC